MNKNETDLVELMIHLEALLIHAERELPCDIRETLQNEINYVEQKIEAMQK